MSVQDPVGAASAATRPRKLSSIPPTHINFDRTRDLQRQPEARRSALEWLVKAGGGLNAPERPPESQTMANHPSITEKQRRWLKGEAHPLKPVVMIGQAGLTAAVLAELELALDHHELLKVKVSAGDRELRDALIAPMVEQTGATLVTRIGNIAVLYRGNPKKREPLVLPAV
jgi:RNA-binding protein